MITYKKKKITSIGEDRKAIKRKVRSGNASRKDLATLERIKGLSGTKNVFGEVFITKANAFGDPTPNSNKTRRVVAIRASKSGMTLVPVRRTGPILFLSNFDGDRLINVNSAKKIGFDSVYEKSKFPNTKNDWLTSNEKVQLRERIHRAEKLKAPKRGDNGRRKKVAGQ